MKIHENIRNMRRAHGMTQEELAAYLGVTASAVNKWEKGLSYPDITFLPILASYFNISVDELLGYEPQMTREDIRKLYQEMAERLSREPFGTVYAECEEYVRKYHSCFPLVMRMAGLYLNHCQLCEDPQALMERIISMTDYVIQECREIDISKEAQSIQRACWMLQGHPEKILESSDEVLHPIDQEMEGIGQAYFMLGNAERAQEYLQSAAYQHLLMLIGDTGMLISGQKEYSEQAEQMIRRSLEVAELFHVEALHFNTMFQLYLAIAEFYVRCAMEEKALEILERYVSCCVRLKFPIMLHGDDYFTSIGRFLEELSLGTMAPRTDRAIRESIVGAVCANPASAPLTGNERFRRLTEKLKRHLEEEV